MTELALDATSLAFSYLEWNPMAKSSFQFDDLQLKVPCGGVYGLIGPNGCGKSTLLEIAMGILPAKSGELRVLGLDPARDPAQVRRRVGYVPQKSDLDPEMTIQQSLDFIGMFFPDHWNPEVARQGLDRFQLTRRVNSKVGNLSTGFQQRLSLIAALAIEPEVLILDEPTAGLDAVVRRHFADAVIDYMATGAQRTVVISSHLLSEIEALVDHVGILHDTGYGTANMLVELPLEELKAKALVVRARSRNSFDHLDSHRFLRTIHGSDPVTALLWVDNEEQRQQVLTELEAADVDDFRIGASSLDEIFVALVQQPLWLHRNVDLTDGS